MKPIQEAIFGLIDITYYCGRGCVYCTRCDRHLGNKRYHMTLEQVEQALQSYYGFKGLIGIIGGEPLLHPQFKEICEIIRVYYPAQKMHLFTSIDPVKSKYASDIKKTFAHIAYHPHNEVQEATHFHQPLTIAIKDVVKNKQLRADLIDDCAVQRKWCPTITNDGAFFCEVGASIAKLLGVKGWDVLPDWWIKEPKDFGYQKEICQYCGMCIPMERQLMSNKKQKISPSFLAIVENAGDYELFDKEITVKEMKEALPTWTPLFYKDEQILTESFQFSTLDWNKYAD